MNEKFSEKKDNILEVKNLTKKFSLESGFFARKDRFVYALNNVSFEIERGKTYGLVGVRLRKVYGCKTFGRNVQGGQRKNSF